MKAVEYIASLNFDGDDILSGERSPEFLVDGPKMVAEREADMRIERLNRVWGHANAIANSLSNHYKHLWNGAITELADYKGVLTITWRDDLSRVMFEGVILGAWESNGEHLHEHHLA